MPWGNAQEESEASGWDAVIACYSILAHIYPPSCSLLQLTQQVLSTHGENVKPYQQVLGKSVHMTHSYPPKYLFCDGGSTFSSLVVTFIYELSFLPLWCCPVGWSQPRIFCSYYMFFCVCLHRCDSSLIWHNCRPTSQSCSQNDLTLYITSLRGWQQSPENQNNIYIYIYIYI